MWASPHVSGVSSHITRCIYLYPVQRYWHFAKFKMASAAVLDFQFMWVWLFRRVYSMVLVFFAKFGSIICNTHWDRCTYASDLYLMTSRELTSGFDFWSRGHLRMAVCIFLYNLMQDIFILSGVIDIFPKFKMAAAAILDFQFMWIWPFRRVDSVVFVFCTKFGSNVCYSHWDRRTYRPSFDDVTRINFWFRLLVTCSSLHDRDASSHEICADIFFQSVVIDIFSKIKDGGRRHFGFVWVSHGTTHEASFVVRTSCKNFVMIG